MSERDVMQLLQEANNVHPGDLSESVTGATAEHILESILAGSSRTRFPPTRRLVILTVVIGGVVAAALVSFFALRGHSDARRAVTDSPSFEMGLGSGPTIEHPLSAGATRIPLSEAASILGAPVPLPTTSIVRASDAGPVWAASQHDSATGEKSGTVAVTFPSQALIVRYTRPVPYPDPLANYQGFVKDSPGSQVIDLNGVPALAIAQLPDGSNFGSIEFVGGSTMIVIMGHQDESALRDVALSILQQVGS